MDSCVNGIGDASLTKGINTTPAYMLLRGLLAMVLVGEKRGLLDITPDLRGITLECGELMPISMHWETRTLD